MSSPNASRSRVVIRKLIISLWMLMFPEVVVIWAFRQWHQARTFAKRYEARGWTIEHGHFALMGGFMLFQSERPSQVLSPSRFNRLLQSGCIEFPSITSQDIKRRRKAHPILTAITGLQASWFIIQCVARGIRGLTITQMEMMTLALLAMYALLLVAWWHKPLDAQDFFRLDLTHIPLSDNVHVQAANINGDFAREQKLGMQFEAGINLEVPFWTTEERNSSPMRTFKMLFSLPGLAFGKLCYQYHQLSFPSGSKIPEGSTEIPLFYSQPLTQPLVAFSFCIMNTLGSLFAASHLLLASPSHFPSIQDQMRWLFSAAACTILPILLAIVASVVILVVAFSLRFWNRIPNVLFQTIRGFIICVPIFGCCARLGFRLWLFAGAALCLRGLGANVRIAVPWTNYIPHFH